MKSIPRPDNSNNKKEKIMTNQAVNVTDPGHLYILSNGQQIQFMKRDENNVVTPGITNEELITVLMDRMNWLDEKLPCVENEHIQEALQDALMFMNVRTLIRTQQKVKGSLVPHDPVKAIEYLKTIKSNTL